MNIALVILLGFGLVVAAFTGTLPKVSNAIFASAKDGAALALSLIGVMAFFLGLMKILEEGGAIKALANALRPVIAPLFPQVPRDHPAFGAILLNFAANMLGLGNAATPFGLKAMGELSKLQPVGSTKATNAMCMFLAINTSSITLLPLGLIGVRAAAGATDPASITLPSLLATTCSSVVAILSCVILGRFNSEKEVIAEHLGRETSDLPLISRPSNRGSVLAGILLGGAFSLGIIKKAFESSDLGLFLSSEFPSHWLIPSLIVFTLAYGLIKSLHVYELLIEGAKESFQLAIKLIPYLVTIMVAVAVFREGGAISLLGNILAPVIALVGMPIEVLPIALIRPLSGSGSFALTSAIIQGDPNGYNAFLASVMQGSTETTFYVISLYLGAVGIKNGSYVLVAGILADIAGVVAACLIAPLFF